MAVTDTNKIDGMGISNDQESLILMIADHLPWDDEAAHLLILQDKINAYVSFLESGQWKQHFSQEFRNFTILINFMHDITKDCEKFLQAVQDQLGQYGILIKAKIM